MAALWGAALSVALVTTSGVAATSMANPPRTATVRVDLRVKHQVMEGFGSSSRVWSDPHLSDTAKTVVPLGAQRAILRDLYGRLGLTRLRPVLDQGVQGQRGAPFSFRGKLADAHIELAKQARRYGLKTIFPGPVYLERWIGPDDVGDYVKWAMAMLQRWRAAGIELALYAPQNEPQVNGDFQPDFLRRVVIELGRSMRAAGFKTKLVVPDDENPVDAYRRASAILADPQARKYVGAIAYHIYRIGDAGDIARMRDLGDRYGLPLWMTEYNNRSYGAWPAALEWSVKMHELMTVGGVSAIDYLWGFFGDWIGGESMVSIDFDGGVYRDESFTPVYWITGQWSRYVRPGYRRVAATATANGVLTSAFVGRRKVVIVSVNPGHDAKSVNYSFSGGTLGPAVTPVRTSAEEDWRTRPTIRVRRSAFTAQLPGNSVTTFLATQAVSR